LKNRIGTKQGSTDHTLSINIEMQDPLVAAQITDYIVKNLSKYIIDYRTQKAKNDLQFINERHTEAEAKYIRTQQALAMYRDQNKFLTLESSRSEEERLKADFAIATGVYNTLSQQLEQAKIKVQEKTPIFKIVNPAIVPLEKSKPNITFIFMAMALLGGFVGAVIIIMKSFKSK
jgi:uncharacterized protein involved in exopolysaccharide biosynthesis